MAEESSWLEVAVQRGRSAEGSRRRWKQGREVSQQKSERRLLRPDDLHRGRVNQCEKISTLTEPFVEVSRKIHSGDSLQMHEDCRVSQNFFSWAWSRHKSVFVRSSFFSHPLGCALRICNETCDTPGWEPLDESLDMNCIGFKKLISRGSAVRSVITFS